MDTGICGCLLRYGYRWGPWFGGRVPAEHLGLLDGSVRPAVRRFLHAGPAFQPGADFHAFAPGETGPDDSDRFELTSILPCTEVSMGPGHHGNARGASRCPFGPWSASLCCWL